MNLIPPTRIKHLLVCPDCRQAVHIKQGAIKRKYFAHKKGSTCQLDQNNDQGESYLHATAKYILVYLLSNRAQTTVVTSCQ